MSILTEPDSRLIPLSKGKFAIVDDRDFEWLSQWKWHFHPTKPGSTVGYACRWVKQGQRQFIHRAIMERHGVNIEGLQVDHINRDPLDNRLLNLRPATLKQNLKNKRVYKNSSTGISGVYWKKGQNAYCARIEIDGKTKHLGYFSNIEDAARTRREAEKLYYGEFATT